MTPSSISLARPLLLHKGQHHSPSRSTSSSPKIFQIPYLQCQATSYSLDPSALSTAREELCLPLPHSQSIIHLRLVLCPLEEAAIGAENSTHRVLNSLVYRPFHSCFSSQRPFPSLPSRTVASWRSRLPCRGRAAVAGERLTSSGSASMRRWLQYGGMLMAIG